MTKKLELSITKLVEEKDIKGLMEFVVAYGDEADRIAREEERSKARKTRVEANPKKYRSSRKMRYIRTERRNFKKQKEALQDNK